MSPAQHLISRFGGVTELSRETGIPVSTISGWQRESGRQAVPIRHIPALMLAARRLGLRLTLGEVLPELSSNSVGAHPLVKGRRRRPAEACDAVEAANDDARRKGQAVTQAPVRHARLSEAA